jgi:hypothetical protein
MQCVRQGLERQLIGAVKNFPTVVLTGLRLEGTGGGHVLTRFPRRISAKVRGNQARTRQLQVFAYGVYLFLVVR